MVFQKSVFLLSDDRKVTFHNVTEEVKKAVAESGIKTGVINVSTPHTTCSVCTQELAFAELHDEDARGCHNTDAHLRSQLIGRSETIAVIDGEADLGSFGHVFLIDFDTTRQRQRKLRLTVMGE